MSFFDSKTFATRVVIALVASAPVAAHASLPAPRVLCEAAAANPKGFRARTDFDAAIAVMAPKCPEVVLRLLDLPTQTIRGEIGKGPSDKAQLPDYSGLIDSLKGALRDLKDATAAVGTAQASLDDAAATVKRLNAARSAILSDKAVSPKKLSGFTRDLTQALEDYNIAKQGLSDAKEALEKAKGDAETTHEVATKIAARTAKDEALKEALAGRTLEAAKLAAQDDAARAALDALKSEFDNADLALATAKAAVDEDTAAARQLVAEAESALEQAKQKAIDLVLASEEELAAKKRIEDAQAALEAARAKQEAASKAAGEAADGAAGVDDPAVQDLVTQLKDAVGDSDDADSAAEQADSDADNVIGANTTARGDLVGQLVDDQVIQSPPSDGTSEEAQPADPQPAADAGA